MSQQTVTRADLADAVYRELRVSMHDASDMVDVFFEEISNSLANHDPVKLASFGTFSLRHKKARVGRNPKTGVEVVITPRTVLSFNPSNIMKQKINENLT